jgi:acyl-CoA synthetase (AMP-forming)/AMP-acid ligase II
VFSGGWTLTYAELAERVERQAAAMGVGKCLVALEADSSEHAVIAYLAALQRGHAVAMLPPGDAEAASRFEEAFRPDIHARRIGGRWRLEELSHGSRQDLHPELALLLSTSGSTGLSRFVRLSGKNLEANACSIAAFLGLTQRDRAALVLPLHYCYGLSVLHSHLSIGASVFLPGGSILDEGFAEALRQSRCTNCAGVPYSYELLERIGFRKEPLPDLRFMTVAGGRMTPELAERYHEHLAARGACLFLMYGQTEATARMAFVPPERLAGNFDRIGVAIPGGTLEIVDEAGRPIEAAEVPGELVYRGPNVMMGYGSSRADLGRGKDIHALRTGDLAARDRDGLFRVTGRLRRMSKIAGLRVAHDGMEHALAEKGVAAAVVGDDRLLLAAYASAHPEVQVRQALADASGLPPSHLRAERLDGLPRLASGKLDYERLKGLLSGPPEPAAGTVRAAFEEAFFPHRVTDRDSFVSLAGDSLRYVHLSMSLQCVLGRLPAGWESRTVGELAAQSARRPDVPMTLGADLLVRALAILLVVVQHATLWPVPGGAAAMVLLVGYSLARFQYAALLAGDVRRVFRPLAAILLPYALIVAGYGIAWGEIPWASVFLVGNFGLADPVGRTMVPFLYWFVEAYVQMLLIWTALFLLPAVRRLASRDPFRFGLTFLAAAVALRFVGPELWPIGNRQIFTIPWILYLAVFGWCVAFADTTARKLVLVALGAIVFPLMAYFGGNWTGAWVKYLLQLQVLSLLLFMPRIHLPKPVLRSVLPISAASFHIYLFHRFVPELLLRPLEAMLPGPLFTGLAVAGGVGLGLLAYEAQKQIVRALAAIRRQERRIRQDGF